MEAPETTDVLTDPVGTQQENECDTDTWESEGGYAL